MRYSDFCIVGLLDHMRDFPPCVLQHFRLVEHNNIINLHCLYNNKIYNLIGNGDYSYLEYITKTAYANFTLQQKLKDDARFLIDTICVDEKIPFWILKDYKGDLMATITSDRDFILNIYDHPFLNFYHDFLKKYDLKVEISPFYKLDWNNNLVFMGNSIDEKNGNVFIGSNKLSKIDDEFSLIQYLNNLIEYLKRVNREKIASIDLMEKITNTIPIDNNIEKKRSKI